MMKIPVLEDKSTRLFIFLGSFFLANALIAEFIGVKIFSLERVFGKEPIKMAIFGEDVSFSLTAGVLLWPLVFVMTDVINEYFGRKGVKFFSYIAVGMIAYSFLMFFLAINADPADVWIYRNIMVDDQEVTLNMQLAFQAIFNQGNLIIIGSITAFLIGQLVDVHIFHFIKGFTGERLLWLRATGSTLVSQFIDSFVVLIIAFYLPGTFTLVTVLALGIMQYIYKFTAAVVLTPLIYLAHVLIDRYLGEADSLELRRQAMNS